MNRTIQLPPVALKAIEEGREILSLLAYRDEAIQDALTDALADLFHVAIVEAMDIPRLVERAREHARAERAGEL